MSEDVEKKGFAYDHATPLPVKGYRRMRLDAARQGDPLISRSAWLAKKKRGAPTGKKNNIKDPEPKA